MTFQLSDHQQRALNLDGSLLLVGSAGTGKTTVLVERMKQLIEQSAPAYSIIVLVADPRHKQHYLSALQSAEMRAHTDLQINHFGDLARQMVTLFWPLIARDIGFASSYKPPTFLGYDLAQLLMWRIIEPMIEGGAFSDLRRRPQQIVSQLLDTLNRSALNRLDINVATERQISTWVGEKNHVLNLQLALDAASQFREHCLQNNLLDLSLTIHSFDQQLLGQHQFSRYFSQRFQHMIVDNLEEQTPAGQAFVEALIDQVASATIAIDEGGGYRRFLAADPDGAMQFKLLASRVVEFGDHFVASAELDHLAHSLCGLLEGQFDSQADDNFGAVSAENLPIETVINTRYQREMIIELAAKIRQLTEQGVPMNQIAIIVPYLDSAIRYSLTKALKQEAISMNIIRRRASPRDEPKVRAWLTWVALAHPDWGIYPTEFDVAEALDLTIYWLDPVRAAILAQAVYPANSLQLHPPPEISSEQGKRIGEESLAKYAILREWLTDNGGQHNLDQFLYRMFNEILGSRAFQPEPDLEAAGVLEWLVATANNLVNSAESLQLQTKSAIGNAFLTAINKGLITSQPPEMGDPPDPNGVQISTIYGYLLGGQQVDYQVWLEPAASGWWDIPKQPLSNAFVLAASYNPEKLWTITEEINIRNQLLARIVRGLTARCKKGIILANSDLDRRGQMQDGALWRTFNMLGINAPAIDFQIKSTP